MKIEIDLYRPEDVRAFGDFCYKVAEGHEHRFKEVDKAFAEPEPLGDSDAGPVEQKKAEQTEAKQDDPPKRGRGRPRKADTVTETTASEPTPPIEEPEGVATRTSDDTQPDPEPEQVDDIFDTKPAAPVYPPTEEGLKAAMKAHATAFGMAETQKHGPKLLGYPKLSAVPNAEYGAAIARFVAAVDAGKAGGA